MKFSGTGLMESWIKMWNVQAKSSSIWQQLHFQHENYQTHTANAVKYTWIEKHTMQNYDWWLMMIMDWLPQDINIICGIMLKRNEKKAAFRIVHVLSIYLSIQPPSYCTLLLFILVMVPVNKIQVSITNTKTLLFWSTIPTTDCNHTLSMSISVMHASVSLKQAKA